MSAHLRAGPFLVPSAVEGAREGAAGANKESGAVSGTECRRRSKGRGRRSEQRERWPFRALKMRPVRQEAVHSLWSRLFCGPLKMRRVPEKAVFGTEYLFRTVEACFLHRMLPKMRRVPQEAFLSTARIFRTIGGPLRYRMPDTGRLPPQRSLAYILVDLLCTTGLTAVSINPLQALAVGVSCNGAQQGVHITYK